MVDKYVFEKIKQRYEKSNKYILYVTYENIGILIHIINILDKQLKYRKEESNIKLTKEQKENIIKYLRNYKDSLNEKSFKENTYEFKQLIQHISNINDINDIIYRLEE